MRLQGKLVAATLFAACAYSASTHAAEPVPLEYTVVKSFSTLYDQTGNDPLSWGINSTDGIAWDGSGIWMTGCGETRLGKLDENGTLLDEFMLPDVAGSDHIAWDGQFLWAVVHSMPNDSGPLDSRLIQIDTAARSIVKTVTLPWGDKDVMAPMGLAWDGKNLWTHHPGTSEIYRIDPDTGAGKDQPIYSAPSFNGQQLVPCGISYDEHSCLWVSDLNMSVGGGRGGYFQIVPETGEIVSYLVPPDNPDPTKYGEFRPASVKKLFTGMTTDGERVWVVDELEGNPLIYELDVSFQTTGPCARAVGLGELCVPGGEPFCGDGAVCHGEPAAETCQVPAALGELCVPGGEPFCGDDAACYGKPAAETCRVACDVAAPSCPDDLTCQSIADVGDVCLPAPSPDSDETEDAGCSCSVVGPTWGGRAGGSLLLAGLFLWLRRRRYGLPAR